MYLISLLYILLNSLQEKNIALFKSSQEKNIIIVELLTGKNIVLFYSSQEKILSLLIRLQE